MSSIFISSDVSIYNNDDVLLAIFTHRHVRDSKTFLATFVILAQIKIGYTTFLIIQPVYVFSPYGGYKWFVYVDASVKYFQSEHLLYALPALVFSATLVVIPLMLLFLYLWERG